MGFIRRFLRNLRNSLHVLSIGITLARYDALFVFDALKPPGMLIGLGHLIRRRDLRDKGPGLRLAHALEAMGPSFIKFGQSLSTRADIVGEEVALGLAHLRDRLAPFPTAQAKAIIEAELNTPLAEKFATFEDTPVAAASIAQVHFATTTDGRAVAVKIVRPGIAQAIARDIELFFWLAETVDRIRPELKRFRHGEMVETFAASMRLELDLRFEAAAAVELAENMADEPDFYVPQVDWARTACRVLTTERIYGIRVSDVALLAEAGHDLKHIVEIAANSFFKQVFRDGFFHADLHPGNLFVTPAGKLAVVDFGIMGRIDYPNRLVLAQILHGFLTEDYEMVARVHSEAGYIGRHIRIEEFAQGARAIGKPITGKPLNEISVGQLLSQLMTVAETYDMRPQPHLLLLQKTMVVAEGVGRMLYPEINMWQLAEPLIREWMQENFGVKARAKFYAGEAKGMLARLPELMKKFECWVNTQLSEQKDY